MRRGLLWSHVLASILGGLVLAAVLLGFGVIGKQRTVTEPIVSPQTEPNGTGPVSNLQSIYDDDSPGVVQVRTRISHAVTSPFITGGERAGSIAISSGFLISRQGFILTTDHGILGVDGAHPRITVVFDTDTSRQAEIVAESAGNDIALLRVNMTGVPTQIQNLPVGDSKSVNAGSSVLTLGNPFGLERTLGSGIVSALQRRLSGIDSSMVDDVIQTDVAANPRADGGPLLDSVGDVIGINSQIQVRSGGTTFPVGFAIPINTARSIIPKDVLP